MVVREHRADYVTGRTLKEGAAAAEWREFPVYDVNWGNGVTRPVEAV